MTRLSASLLKRYPGGGGVEINDFAPVGPVTVLFGPSGSGKSTLLRCLAGLERPDQGEIQFADTAWFRSAERLFLPAERRNIGFVPQHYTLFPHLTVGENIAYGLAGHSPTERRRQIAEALTWLGLIPLANRRPTTLSGGEQQRVALARALVRRPALLLLDEPFAALDTPTRQRLRIELSELLNRLHIPTVLVTHDRLEAATLGNEIWVMVQGRVIQQGPVDAVFNHPTNLAAAQLLGTDTILHGTMQTDEDELSVLTVGRAKIYAVSARSLARGQAVAICIRAEDVMLTRAPQPNLSARNQWPATVTSVRWEGALARVELDCGFPLKALLTRQSCSELNLQTGDAVTALVKASQIHLPDSSSTNP